MDKNLKKEIQSATFERLIKHLDERKDVQNIDLMNLAGFCRNCLSRWFREEASSLNHLDKQFLQKPAKFIRSMFCTSFLSSKCLINLSNVADCISFFKFLSIIYIPIFNFNS